MARHLAIFQQPYINRILTGQKTIESRFSQVRGLPYNAVKKGDIVVMKESGARVLGEFAVAGVDFFELLTPERTQQLIHRYALQLCLDREWIERKADSRYATLIFIKSPVRYDNPYDYRKKDMRSWIVLEQDVLQ